MNYLKRFNESKDDIASICKKYNITNYTINSDGTIDVDDDVDLRGSEFWKKFQSYSKSLVQKNWNLNELPLKFGKVSGSFDCRYNYLTTLEGCPSEVSGDFYCSDNLLTSLEGCPNEVRRFLAGDNLFSDLTGCPQVINGDFNVSRNPNLISLKGGPKKVLNKGYYSFSNTELIDPSRFSEMDYFNGSISFNNTPFCNVLGLFLSKEFGLACECKDLNTCRHLKDDEYIYLMIRTIIDRNIINGNEIILDRLYSLYYDLLDESAVNLIEGELNLPGYVLI
jgi:hypothetical protein